MAKKKEFTVQDTIIRWQMVDDKEYISLTDMVKGHSTPPRVIVANWMRTKTTMEFMAAWEILNNPDFNRIKFDTFLIESGRPQFTMSADKWQKEVQGIGIYSKSGRYGGTYAHKDIAFNFATSLSAMFHLLLIREFQRLKEAESTQQQLEWNANRFLTKRNYSLHTEAIKRNLLPQSTEPPEKDWLTYAGEADILNMALFGTTAQSWRENHPTEAKKGENIRDHANTIQLVVLSNLEAINSELIKEGLSKDERFIRLHHAAKDQLKIFYRDEQFKNPKDLLG